VLVLHIVTVKKKSSTTEQDTVTEPIPGNSSTDKQNTHNSATIKSRKAYNDFKKLLIPLYQSFGLNLPKSDLDNREASNKAPLADSIALAGLFITLTVTGIYPFLQSPLLDYTLIPIGNESNNIQKYSLEVSNWGLASAKNALFSLQSDNVRFLEFKPQPFLSSYFKENTNLTGYGFFEIHVIPPRSDTTIYAKLDTSNANSNQPLVAFVRSDEKVGYHDTAITIIFYIILGAAYILLFLWMVFKKKLENIRRRHIPWYLLIIVAYIVLFSLVYTLIYGIRMINIPS
jgi:hypothetical protein